jgi:hypothetical protein
VILCTLLGTPSSAQPPDLQRDYRFIPRRSSLEVTEGFAGIRQKFFPYGTFSINTGYDVDPRDIFPPILIPHAEFVIEEWESWLVPDSPLAFVWNTDRTLNLTGLDGTFRVGEPNRILFKGVDGQDQPFKLMAVQRGRLLHLMGENDPGCCDFFKYRFDAFAYQLPYPDFNLDGMVDRADMDTLMSNIGMQGSATLEHGDANGDGNVDGHDFLVWQAAIGPMPTFDAFANDSFVDGGFGTAVVPEPAALVLWLAGAMLLMSWYVRRARLPIV